MPNLAGGRKKTIRQPNTPNFPAYQEGQKLRLQYCNPSSISTVEPSTGVFGYYYSSSHYTRTEIRINVADPSEHAYMNINDPTLCKEASYTLSGIWCRSNRLEQGLQHCNHHSISQRLRLPLHFMGTVGGV